MSIIRSLVVLVIASVGILAGSTFLRFNQTITEQIEQQAEIESLQTYTITQGSVRETVSALGSVDANAVVDVSFQASGRVTEVLVETGDVVYAGMPLARLEDSSQRIDYEQARLALERADLSLEDLLGPVDEDELRVAEANLNSAQGGYTSAANQVSAEEIEAAELRYEQAQQDYLEAENARRVSGNLNAEEVAQLDAELGELAFTAEIARLDLETLRGSNDSALNEAGAQITQAQRELEQVLAGPTQSEINDAVITLQRAEADLRDAETALNRRTLVSPVDGMVSSVSLDVAQPVTAGTTVIEVTDASILQLFASVDETDVAAIAVGMPALVQLDALADVEVSAQVTHIDLAGTETDNVVSYTTELVLENLDPRIRVGMTGEAFIILEQREEVLVVPNAYLRIDPQTGGTRVDVLRPNGTREAVDMRTGLRGDEMTEILSGLREGDVVVMNNNALAGLGGGQ